MSIISEQSLAAPAMQTLSRISAALSAVRDQQRRYFVIRRTRKKLRELPDWVLRDIGICRDDIHDLASRLGERAGNETNQYWWDKS